MQETNRTEIATLGEFGLIKHLTQNIELKNPETKYGVGDDAAVLEFKDKEVLVTTDLLMEGVHFDLIYTPLKHLGYKSAHCKLLRHLCHEWNSQADNSIASCIQTLLHRRFRAVL